ncbi:MAG TPA: acyltransferase [Terriglobales bacterium]|nr:acyltransferase [Terriglobales bacterium]
MKRIPSLDGLRAISISLVILGHWVTKHQQLTFLAVYANVGVRIFFVISGYLITTLLLSQQQKTGRISLRDFYARRAFRILPAAFTFIVPVIVLHWGEMRWYDIAAAMLYLVNFDFACPWFIGHLWSLSVEEQFYLLWPAILHKWFRHRVKVLIAVVIIAPIYSAVCYRLKVPAGGYGTFPAVADNLAIGCLLALFAPHIRKIGRGVACAMAIAVVLIPLFAANTPGRTLFMLFILWPVLHLSISGVLLHAVQERYRLLNFGPIVFLGKISYSLYLWQQLFFFRPEPLPIYLALPLALSFACLSYFLVEQPMLRLRDSKRRFGSQARLRLAAAGD